MEPMICPPCSSAAHDKIDSNHASDDLSHCSKDSLIALPSNQGILDERHNIDVPVINDYSDLMRRNNTFLNTRSIQKAIKTTTRILNNWDCELKVGLYVNGVYTDNYNIMEALTLNKLMPPYLYFDPLKFSPLNGFYGEGWTKLLQYLGSKSLEEGFSICSNGYGKKSKHKYRRIVCKCSLQYRNSYTSRKSVDDYRVTKSCNDRLNSRGPEGRKMNRRSRTSRPDKKDKCCPFFISIAYDCNGFFVKNSLGCPSHFGHPKIDKGNTFCSLRRLSKEERLIAKSVIDADANKSIVRNVLAKRTGQTVSLSACHYLGKLDKDLKRLAALEGLSSSDRIIQFFQEKNYDYITLYNSLTDEFKKDTIDLVNDNFLTSNAVYTNTKFVVPAHEQSDISNYTLDNRNNRKLSKDQNLLVAMAWVVPEERRLFILYPETLFVDAVEDTNNEGRPLLAMGGCDGNGKMFTFLRAFLPNQRTWSFRWLFMHVLPTMFSENIIRKIKVIISDGDPQEYSQIDNAINHFCPSIYRIRCGWHVIDRGWDRRGPKSSQFDNKIEFKAITSNVRNWMFSWCSSSVETEDEYNISKQLFEKYLYSKHVVDSLGISYPNQIMNWFRGYVEPVLPRMLFYKRKHIRHFDYYSNVKLEGVFSGIKNGATPVTPGTTLHNSVALLSNMAERKCSSFNKNRTYDVLTKKTWISLSMGDELNLRGEQIITSQWNRRTFYNNVRISSNKWLVAMDPSMEHSDIDVKSIQPIFKRIRKVTIKKSILYCSCHMFERFGIPCRHMFNVLGSFPNYIEPSIYDVSVRYWKQYSHYCYNKNNKQEKAIDLGRLLKNLHDNDTKGPFCTKRMYSNVPICTEIPSLFRNDGILCRNYDIKNLVDNEILHHPSGYGITMSISQDCHDTLNMYQSDEESVISLSSSDDLDETFVENSKQKTSNDLNCSHKNKTNAYGELMPIFQELVKHLKNKSQGDINRVKSLIRSELNFIQQSPVNETNKEPKGTYVSSTADYVKKRKTHGTKYCYSMM